MSGTVKQFVDFSNNTANDTGANTATSIQRINDGETLDQTTLRRPSESLRQRTEALKNAEGDSLFLRDADRGLIIAGPGRVTWPGSTTVAASGIPVLSDVLWLLPMLTPGFAQVAPVPPVASSYGVIHLKRASDNMNSILVTSQRRSYAAGDQINITVSAGAVFSCTLDTATGYERTINIVATGSTTLSTVITALNLLTPTAPDNTPLVTAALEGGAVGGDLLLTVQAKQYVSGNYDGEGHTITPANLAAFFVGSPGSALAEGDSLCIEYTMVTDTASTGGRRQALPENSNTSVPIGSFFNSRVNPEKLVNALPICKVVDGSLVFGTGSGLAAGAVAASINNTDASGLTYAGGGAWADGTTNPATTVEGQFDKVISDLAGATGTGKVQGSATFGLTSATLAAQLGQIVKKTPGVVTVGNGTTIFGDYNTSDYANNKLMLEAAFAALPALGGTVLIKQGVTLTGFGGAVVTNAGLKKIIIQGYHVQNQNSSPHITFTTNEWFEMTNLQLKDLWIQHADHAMKISGGGYKVTNCVFDRPTSTVNKAAIINNTLGSGVSGLICEDVVFRTDMTPANGTVNAMAIDLTGGETSNITLRRVVHYIPGDECGSLKITDLRDDFVIDDYECQGGGGAANLVEPKLISLDTTTNSNITNRVIRNFRANGVVAATAAAFNAVLATGNVGALLIDRMVTMNCKQITETFTAPSEGVVTFRNCSFTTGLTDASFVYVDSSTDVAGFVFEGCSFIRTGVTLSSNPALAIATNGAVASIRVSNCTFKGFRAAAAIHIIQVATSGNIQEMIVDGCHFETLRSTTGGTACALVSVSSSGGFVTHTRVTNNHAFDIISTAGGAKQFYLLYTSAIVLQNIIITNNIVGYVNGHCGLWVHNSAGSTQHVHIKDNIQWSGQLGDSDVFLQGSAVHVTVGTHYNTMISGNTFYVAQGVTNYNKDVIYMSASARMMQVVNNHFEHGYPYDYVAGWGINFAATALETIIVAGNASKNNSGVTDSIRIKTTGVVTAQLNDITPGVGVAVAGNLGVAGAA